jgi:hypothetical protein
MNEQIYTIAKELWTILFLKMMWVPANL